MDARPSPVEGMVIPSSEFWKSKSVFLTGHTGFKGSWASLWLVHLGARVTGYSLPPPTHPSLFEAARVSEGIDNHLGDVRDADMLLAALEAAQPEVVLHMAAQPLVRQSYLDPLGTYATNSLGTACLLEACRKVSSIRAIVVVTTDKCYDERESASGYRETDPLGGCDPYSSSKAAAELVVSAMRKSFNLPAATVRAGNVIGGGDWARDRLIPDIVCAWQRKEHIDIRYPTAIRPWQHVLEPLRGYFLVAQRVYEDGRRYAEAWNFGPRPEDAWPVEEVVRHMARLWGDEASWNIDGSAHPREAPWLMLDISKSRTFLGWQPLLTLDRALEWTSSWYRSFFNGAEARDLCEKQIQAYERELANAPLLAN